MDTTTVNMTHHTTVTGTIVGTFLSIILASSIASTIFYAGLGAISSFLVMKACNKLWDYITKTKK